MNITQENIDDVNAVLKVNVVEEDYLPKVQTALKDYSKKATVPGFRPGKVPVGLIKKMYGKSIVVDEVNKVLNDSIYRYINDNQLEVLGNPMPKVNDDFLIDWENQKDFEFFYEVGLAPKFSVDISAADKLEYETVLIDETLINKYVSDLTSRYGKVVNDIQISENRDLLTGDFVELDANNEILPSGIFKSGGFLFIDRIKNEVAQKPLLGLKMEDKVILSSIDLRTNGVDLSSVLSIDKKISENLTSNFQLTLKNISRVAPAEINQELFNKIYGEGKINSEEEFKTKIKEELAAMFLQDSERKFYNNAVEFLMKKINFILPTEFLKRWYSATNDKTLNSEEVDEMFSKQADGLKWQLIENKLIKQNNIKVTSEEIIEHTKNMFKLQFAQYNSAEMNLKEEDLDKAVKQYLSKEEDLKKINDQLYGNKVLSLLKSSFTIENKESDYDTFFEVKK